MLHSLRLAPQVLGGPFVKALLLTPASLPGMEDDEHGVRQLTLSVPRIEAGHRLMTVVSC